MPSENNPSTHASDLKRLCEKAIARVLDAVDQYGWSIPLAYALGPDGDEIIIAAGSLDEKEPESKDAQVDLKKHAESVLFNIRRMISKGQLRAVAFARDLLITDQSKSPPVQSNAVKVVLDHEAGGGSIAYLVYDPNDGKAKPIELFYNPLQERFFPEGGWPVGKPREPLR